MDRINFDGFPRSGNEFTFNLLKKSFPDVLVNSFQHNANNLTVNHFVVIRNPVEAISSFVSVFKESDLQAAQRWWLRFYTIAAEKTDLKNWILFDNLVNKTTKVVMRFSEKLNTKPVIYNYDLIDKNQAPQFYELQMFDKAQSLFNEIKGKISDEATFK
jgi:hypothetical protein